VVRIALSSSPDAGRERSLSGILISNRESEEFPVETISRSFRRTRRVGGPETENGVT
jgi:hypothetical protein